MYVNGLDSRTGRNRGWLTGLKRKTIMVEALSR